MLRAGDDRLHPGGVDFGRAAAQADFPHFRAAPSTWASALFRDELFSENQNIPSRKFFLEIIIAFVLKSRIIRLCRTMSSIGSAKPFWRPERPGAASPRR